MKKILFHSLFVLLIAFPLTAFAEDAFNKETKKAVRVGYELYGGYITDLGIDTSGRMYASTLSPNGIFHSTDRAENWSGPAVGTDLGKVNALVISDEANIAYVIGGISLYKTTDGGENWTELAGSSGDVETNDFNLALGYSNGVLVAPVRDGSVDISTDEGKNFTNVVVASDSTISSLVGTSDGSTFFILTSTSNDQTRTLYALNTSTQAVTTGTESGNYAWVGVKPTDSNFIVIAGADGARYTTTGISGTWQTLTAEPITGEVNFVGNRIYLGDQYTDDLGGTLTRMELTANQLAVDPNDSSFLVIGSGTGINVSADGGSNWSENAKSNGLLGVTVNDIAQSDSKKSVWLAAQGGLAHSANFLSDAPTWEYPILPDQASTDMNSIWIDPTDPTHLVAGANNLFVSRDGGDSWEVVSSDGTGTFTDIVADGDTLYAAFSEQQGTSGTVYTSTDGGETWTDLTGLDAPANQIAVLNNGTLAVAVGYEFNESEDQRGIFLYDGSSWTHVEQGRDQAMVSIVVVGETIYAVGIGDPDGKMLRSKDNGTTWSNITDHGLPTDAYFHSVAAVDETTLFAATGRPAATSYVYKTTDGGETWSTFYNGLVDEEFNAMLFDGLTTGTSVGLQSLLSKAKLTLEHTKSSLTIKLKDVATQDPLQEKVIRLFKKHKKTGEWERVKFSQKKQTNAKGKLVIEIDPAQTTYYQVRWVPVGTDADAYGEGVYKSERVKVKI